MAFGRQQIGVLAGVLLFGAGLFGWLYYGSAATVITLAMMTVAALLLLLAARALGRMVPRTTYRRERWHQRDILVCGAALGCAVAWIVLWLADAGGLTYNPYAALQLPPFALLAGMAVLLTSCSGAVRTTHEEVVAQRRRIAISRL